MQGVAFVWVLAAAAAPLAAQVTATAVTGQFEATAGPTTTAVPSGTSITAAGVQALATTAVSGTGSASVTSNLVAASLLSGRVDVFDDGLAEFAAVLPADRRIPVLLPAGTRPIRLRVAIAALWRARSDWQPRVRDPLDGPRAGGAGIVLGSSPLSVPLPLPPYCTLAQDPFHVRTLARDEAFGVPVVCPLPQLTTPFTLHLQSLMLELDPAAGGRRLFASNRLTLSGQ